MRIKRKQILDLKNAASLGKSFLLAFFIFSSLESAVAWDAKKFKKSSPEELKKRLSKDQFEITQKEGTEKAFSNPLYNNKEPGIYVDVVSGEPLFSSLDKYDSGTGWPSFTQPLSKDKVTTKTDHKLASPRTEVRSKHADSHLGHVFDDGPTTSEPGGPTPTGLRYCMNSASLRFIPVKDLEKEGYSEYLPLFVNKEAIPKK